LKKGLVVLENIIIKLIENNLGLGVVIALLYFLWGQSVISTINSSEIERLFFTHEKKLIYRISNYLGTFLIIFVLMSTLSIVSLNLIKEFKSLLSIYVRIMFNLLFFMPAILSFLFYILTTWIKVNKLLNWRKKVNNRTITASIITAAYFLSIIISTSFLCARSVYLNFSQNQGGIVIVGAFINSILIPKIIICFIRPYLNKIKVWYSFKDDMDSWYIIKPLKNNEFVIGDSPLEDECSKLKFISYEELKKKELHVHNCIT
jgi:hypothetical protein